MLSDGTNSYLYGPDGLPFEQIDGGGTPSFLHHDQLGSTRMVTATDGSVLGTYSYDPYGTVSGSTGSGDTQMLYAGQYADPDTGLSYMRMRWYDPKTGQFLTRDPLVSISGQPYAYANGDPLDFTDPGGLVGLPNPMSPLQKKLVQFSQSMAQKVVSWTKRNASGISAGASTIAMGCAFVAAPTGVLEPVCGSIEAVSLGAGVLAASEDVGNVVRGKAPVTSIAFDVLGVGLGTSTKVFQSKIDNQLLRMASAFGWYYSATSEMYGIYVKNNWGNGHC